MTHNAEALVKCKTCSKQVDPRLWTEHQTTFRHKALLVITAGFWFG